MAKRMISLLLSMILMVSMGLPLLAVSETDKEQAKDEISGLSSRYDELEKQQQAIQAEINKAKTEKDRKLAEKKQLDTQISNTRNQIAILNQKIALMEKSLEGKIQEVQEQTAEIEVSMNLFKDRMYSMYITPKNSTLSLLLGAKNFTGFLNSMEYATRIANRDKELLDGMRQELENLRVAQKEIEENKALIEQDKVTVGKKEVELGTQIGKVEDEIQDISQLESEYKANEKKLKSEMDQIDKEIEELYKKLNDDGQLENDYAGGSMTWPVPKHSYISSNYGWRFSNTNFHTGFDIAGTGSDGKGIYGKPIVAANDGKVILTQTSYIQGKGYGIYLMIDHGGGISTLYGHTSKLAVKLGETVKRGQTIAYVGSTGWSTGPHLHFEVRKNGSYVNPWTYINKP